jgi:quercetin dioxygenase-like cupin family protein
LRVFRRADAVDLGETTMMGRPVMDPKPPREVFAAIGATTGYVNQVLFGDPGSDSLSLVRLWYAPSYALPRHHHDVDCLYYVAAGEAHLGNQVLHPGDGFFVPAGAPYSYSAGPEGVEVLEFRGTSQFGITVTENLARWEQLATLATEHREDWAAQAAANQ